MKKLKMLNIKKIIFIDTEGTKMIINDLDVKKIKSPVEHYHIQGHVGNENCSGADIGLEFRYVPNECSKNKRFCCNL
jgi:hypothetical protein